jgi:hypothetical protein
VAVAVPLPRLASPALNSPPPPACPPLQVSHPCSPVLAFDQFHDATLYLTHHSLLPGQLLRGATDDAGNQKAAALLVGIKLDLEAEVHLTARVRGDICVGLY